MAFKKSYRSMEIIAAILIAIVTAFIFGFLLWIGWISPNDVRIAMFILVCTTVATVIVKVIVTRRSSSKKRRR